MSRIQQILEGTQRVQAAKDSYAAPRWTKWGVHVGKGMYGVDYSHQRLNAFFNCRAILVCGGCVGGVVHRKTDAGTAMNERTVHTDCQGTGFRLNRRYGRPV